MATRIQSIERAAAILRLLSGRNRRLGVVQLSGELGLPKGTVHGILQTLAGVGFVEQDEETGKYQLGAALLHMGSSYLDGNELRARALNWADALAARSGESVRIGTLHEGRVLVVHHVFRPDDSRQALEVGALQPAHASAMGKVLLAAYRYVAAELTADELRPLHAGDDRRARCAGGRAARGDRARLGRRRRGARRRGVLRGGADRGPPRGHGRGDRDLRAGRAADGRTAPRAPTSCPTSARPRGPSRGTSGPSRGRKGGVSERYVAAVDQGTASSRCLIFDDRSRIVSVSQIEHGTSSPRPGYVEHDPEEIWRNVQQVSRRRSPRSTSDRRATSSASGSRTSARRRCCGTVRRASRCTTRSPGRTCVRTTWCASSGARPAPTASATAAGSRSPPTSPGRRSAGCSTTSTGCASARRPARSSSGRSTRG